MADLVNTSSGILALIAVALTSSGDLYKVIRDLQSQDRKARGLKDEVRELSGVLESLLDTISNHPAIDFQDLEGPLRRCGTACTEYGQLLVRCTSHSSGSRPSVRDWISQKYLQGDIDDFRAMLASYKSTIQIAMANANIRVAAITPSVLEDFKDKITDTTHDLQDHLERLEGMIQSLATKDPAGLQPQNAEWQALLEEKQSTQQGLRICAQLSAQIEQLDPRVEPRTQSSNLPNAHEVIRGGLRATKGAVQTLAEQLNTHLAAVDTRMEALQATSPPSEEISAQIQNLRATRDSISQCLKVVSDAGSSLTTERNNVFEDITMADNSYNFSVSTIGDLVTARRINLTGQSRNVGGQISDESYQKTIEALTRLDSTTARQRESEGRKPVDSIARGDPSQSTQDGHFDNRYGRGIPVSQVKDASRRSGS